MADPFIVGSVAGAGALVLVVSSVWLAYQSDLSAGGFELKKKTMSVGLGMESVQYFQKVWVGDLRTTNATVFCSILAMLIIGAVEVFRRLSRKDPESKSEDSAEVANASGIESLHSLMLNKPQSRSIQLEGLHKMLEAVFYCRENRVKYGALGVCTVVQRSMENFAEDKNVTTAAVVVMGRLCYKNAINAKHFGEDGCKSVLHALDKFVEDEVVAVSCMDTICCMASSEPAYRPLFKDQPIFKEAHDRCREIHRDNALVKAHMQKALEALRPACL